MWDYYMFDFTHNSPSNNAMSQVCNACWSQERLLVVKTVCAMFWSMWLNTPFCAESTQTTSKVPPTAAYKCLLINFVDWRSLILLSVCRIGQLPSLEWKFMWDLNCCGLPALSFFFPAEAVGLCPLLAWSSEAWRLFQLQWDCVKYCCAASEAMCVRDVSAQNGMATNMSGLTLFNIWLPTHLNKYLWEALVEIHSQKQQSRSFSNYGDSRYHPGEYSTILRHWRTSPFTFSVYIIP